MNLKQAIIALLRREALAELCRVLEVEAGGCSREAMTRHLMRRESILAEHMLEFLTEAQVRVVCEAWRVLPRSARLISPGTPFQGSTWNSWW